MQSNNNDSFDYKLSTLQEDIEELKEDAKENTREVKEILKKFEADIGELKTIATIAKIVGGILGVAGLAGIFTMVQNANRTISQTVDSAIQEQVPRMVQAQINNKFPNLETLTQDFEKATAEANRILELSQEVQSSQPLLDKVSGLGSEYSDCAWVSVGYDKSHEDLGEWCPVGSFITQLNLDTDVQRSSGSSPIIAQAHCCAP